MGFHTYIGLAAAMLTTFAFLPQAIKIIRTRHTKDISLVMYIIFTTGIVLWLIYGLFIKDLPIIVANIITLALSISILIMKIRYK